MNGYYKIIWHYKPLDLFGLVPNDDRENELWTHNEYMELLKKHQHPDIEFYTEDPA